MKDATTTLTWTARDVPHVARDLHEDQHVWRDDDEERQGVDHDEVEDVVGQFVGGWRKAVVSDALCEPGDVRVSFHVKDEALIYRKTHLVYELFLAKERSRG